MPDVTESAEQVGQMIVNALQNTLGLGPEEAVAHAQAVTGVSDSTLDQADMGQALEHASSQPGLSPDVQQYLQGAQENYNNYGNVSQGGSSYNGGGSGYSGGGGYGGGSGSSANAQIVQQVTSNYNYQEINDNHIDIMGNVNGDIDIDQDNDDVHDIGDHSAVNTGDGDQNAATGDHSSAAQGEGATSNSGAGAVVAGDDSDVYLDHSAVGDGNYIVDNEDATIDDHSASNGSTVLDNHDGGMIYDSSLGFGDGNVQGDVYNEAGAANSQGGDAHGANLGLNLDSTVNEEHGPGDNNTDGSHLLNGDDDPTRIQTVVEHVDAPDHQDVSHEASHYDAPAEHLAPQVDAEPEHHDAAALDHDMPLGH
jgi:hypothetical protein